MIDDGSVGSIPHAGFNECVVEKSFYVFSNYSVGSMSVWLCMILATCVTFSG